MDKKLRETTNLCVEIMDNNRQLKGKLGHVVHFISKGKKSVLVRFTIAWRFSCPFRCL